MMSNTNKTKENSNDLSFNARKNNEKSQIKRRTRIPFSKLEDECLLRFVNMYGLKNKSIWYFIAGNLTGRTPRQCRERYQLFLSDNIRKKAKWTKEEDEILISKYNDMGPHWKKMEQFFVGRTSYNIKNRFISLNKRNKFHLTDNSYHIDDSSKDLFSTFPITDNDETNIFENNNFVISKCLDYSSEDYPFCDDEPYFNEYLN